MINLKEWEILFENKIATVATIDDPAHDLLHFKRVVNTAKKLCEIENGKFEVVVPAAWFHDFVIVPKDSPLRNKASSLSADEAVKYLKSVNYPSKYYSEIAHGIEGHSFSANIEVKTIEAQIIQDADRLDGLGAIGIARCFATAGLLKRSFYSYDDPFCIKRSPDDSSYTIDHFYKKLFKTAGTLKTKSGQLEGQRRLETMKKYLEDFNFEIST